MPFPSYPTPLRLTIHSNDGDLRFESEEALLPYILEEPVCVDPRATVLEAQRLGTGELIDREVWKLYPKNLLDADDLPPVQFYTLRFDGEAFTKHYAHLNRHCKRERRSEVAKHGPRGHLDDEDVQILNLYLSILNSAGVRLTVQTPEGVRHVPIELSYALNTKVKCS